MTSAPTGPPHSGDVNDGYEMEVGVLVTVCVAFVVVVGRCYSRALIVRSWGLDDSLMLVAALIAIWASGTEVYAVEKGFGRHGYYLSPADVILVLKDLNIAGVGSSLGVLFAKLSICVTLLRILHSTRAAAVKTVIWTVAISVTGVNVLCTTMQFTACRPTAKFWDASLSGDCRDAAVQGDIYFLQASYSAFTDLVLAILPAFVIRPLQMDRASKRGISILMGLGALTGMMAIARTAETYRYFQDQDPTSTFVPLLLMVAIERNSAVTFGSVHAARPLYRQVVNAMTGKWPWRRRSSPAAERTEPNLHNEPTLATEPKGSWQNDVEAEAHGCRRSSMASTAQLVHQNRENG